MLHFALAAKQAPYSRCPILSKKVSDENDDDNHDNDDDNNGNNDDNEDDNDCNDDNKR